EPPPVPRPPPVPEPPPTPEPPVAPPLPPVQAPSMQFCAPTQVSQNRPRAPQAVGASPRMQAPAGVQQPLQFATVQWAALPQAGTTASSAPDRQPNTKAGSFCT